MPSLGDMLLQAQPINQPPPVETNLTVAQPLSPQQTVAIIAGEIKARNVGSPAYICVGQATEIFAEAIIQVAYGSELRKAANRAKERYEQQHNVTLPPLS